MPRSDGAEVKQMMEMFGQVEGIGEPLYDAEDTEFLVDLGIDLENGD